MNNPSPGSKEAVEQGCICAVTDNNNGEGSLIAGEIAFWVEKKCPLHGETIKNIGLKLL